MKHHYILLGFLILLMFPAFGQDATNPVRFQLTVEYLYSNVSEDCRFGGGADNTWRFHAHINGASTGDHCWHKGDDTGTDMWPGLTVFNGLLPDLPRVDINYRGWEESRGSSCDYDRSGVCVDNQECNAWVGYLKADLIDRGAPAQWNRVGFDCGNSQYFQWLYRYNPIRPNQPTIASGVYNVCGQNSYQIQTTDVTKWNETYIWEESSDGTNWRIISGSGTAITLTAPDVSTVERRFYRVKSAINGEESVVSAASAPVWIYPRRPSIVSYSRTQPLCNGGGDATITIQNVNGRLGAGVSKYKVYLAKWSGTSYQTVDLIDPFITNLPYIFDNTKVFGGALRAGQYQLRLENVIDYYPPGSDPLYICASNPVFFTIGEPPVLTLSPQPLNKGTSSYQISCNDLSDGVIRVSASGGTPLYKFRITGGSLNTTTDLIYSAGQTHDFTGLSPNVPYTVAVIDANNCVTQSGTITLTQPPALSSSVSLNSYNGAYNIKCFGETDTAFVYVTGGVSPYTVSTGTLSRNIATDGGVASMYGLDAENLHVFQIVDANNCNITNSASLSQPTKIEPVDFVLTKCNGEGNGSVELKATGGIATSGIYTFALLKDGTEQSNITGTNAYFENLGSGNYSVEIIDNNECLQDTAFLVPLSAIAPVLKDTVICQGQVYELNVEEPGYTYNWTSDKGYTNSTSEISVSQAANYNLLVTNSFECTANSSFDLTISDKHFTANFAIPGKAYENDTIILTEISWPRPNSMTWSMPDSFEVYKTEEGLHYIKLPSEGVYVVKLTAYLGECWDDLEKTITVYDASMDTSVTPKLGFSGIKAINLFPNPNSGSFTLGVELTDEMPVEIDIHDVFKADPVDYRKEEGQSHYTLNYNLSLTPGTYNVTVRTAKDKKNFKFIVQ